MNVRFDDSPPHLINNWDKFIDIYALTKMEIKTNERKTNGSIF
jgi:hypothetical protein